MSSWKALEMAECAQVNLNSLAKMVPGLKDHPMFAMAELQIDECIKELKKEIEE